MEQLKVLILEPNHLHSYPNSATDMLYDFGKFLMPFGPQFPHL